MTQVTETKRPKLHLPFALMGTNPPMGAKSSIPAAPRRITVTGQGPDTLRRLVAAMVD